MRSHGEPNFPDPNSSGRLAISKSSGINPSSSAYQTAATDCKSLNPFASVNGQPSEALAAALKFAQCMQKNGVPNYPDPTAGNGGSIELGPGPDSGINPNSPAYLSAQKKCGSPLPAG